MPIDDLQVLEDVLAIAWQASDLIRAVYAGDFAVDYKGTNDPVTRADREANALICAGLRARFGEVPIVAEESAPETFAGFERAPSVWFVDPLDGTREFVAKNGEFAVMIGRADQGRAALGVIVWPEPERAFIGAVGLGAFEVDRAGKRRALAVREPESFAEARAIISRAHRSERTVKLLEELGISRIEPCGSAGVKSCKVACGESDVYVQLKNAGKRWDSCAPEAIVRAAGGEATDALGRPIDYATADIVNATGFVAAHPRLHAAVVRAAAEGA